MLLTLWIDVDPTLVLVAADVWLLVYMVVGWSRFAGGQTVGMRITLIRVARPDGSDVGLLRSLLRYLVLVLSFMLLGLPLLLVVVTKKRQALHDLVADTVVLEARQNFQSQPAPPSRIV